MMTDIDIRTLEGLPVYYDYDSVIRFYISHRRILFHPFVIKLILHKLEEIISDMNQTFKSKYKLTIFTISNIIMHSIIERALHFFIVTSLFLSCIVTDMHQIMVMRRKKQHSCKKFIHISILSKRFFSD